MKKKVMFCFLLGFVFMFSCSNDQQEIIPDQQVDLNQQDLLSKMKEASMVIAQFAENENVKNELDQMIKLKMYNDDFILFKDLFSPSSNERLKNANIFTTAFEKAFIQAKTGNGLKSGGIDELRDYLISNNLVLYIPYPVEMFPENKRVPTITFHPLVNDSINEGIQAILENNQVIGYKNVTVNDAYALENLCYVIAPAERLGFEGENLGIKSVTTTNSTNHYEIRIKKSRCKVQFDGFFDGGSEVYFGNGTPAIANGHVTAEPLGFLFGFSRLDITLKTVREVNTLFNADWAEDKKQIVMFVYEKDPVGSVEVSGTVKITHSVALADTTASIKVANGWETSQSFKRTYQSEDCVIFNNDYPRDWFMSTNSDPNAEWGEFSSDGIIVRGNRELLDWTMSVTPRTY